MDRQFRSAGFQRFCCIPLDHRNLALNNGIKQTLATMIAYRVPLLYGGTLRNAVAMRQRFGKALNAKTFTGAGRTSLRLSSKSGVLVAQCPWRQLP